MYIYIYKICIIGLEQGVLELCCVCSNEQIVTKPQSKIVELHLLLNNLQLFKLLNI